MAKPKLPAVNQSRRAMLGASAIAAAVAAAGVPKPVSPAPAVSEKPSVGNLVLYRHTGEDIETKRPIRHPIFSCDADDPMAGLLIGQAASEEIRSCKLSGLPACDLQLIHEYREANAEGVITKSAFTLLNPVTLEAIGETKTNLEEI
jgi:hypothetical protein